MVHKGPFKDIFYKPRVARYRIARAENPKLVRAIAYLLGDEPLQPTRADLLTALGVMLKKTIDGELTGVRHNRMLLVEQTGAHMTDYPIMLNAPEVKSPGRTASRLVDSADRPAHIPSLDVAGAAAFYVDQDGGKPASASVSRMLR